MKPSHPRRFPKSLATISAWLLSGLMFAPVRAEYSPYYIGVVETLEHNTNIYRVGDQQVLPPDVSKSDSLIASALIGGIDQFFGRQHATGGLTLRDTRYRSNSQLNNQGYTLNLGLDWSSANRISGRLSASADRNLAQFNSQTVNGVIETRKNIQTINQVDASFALGTVTKFTAEAAVGARQRTFSAPAYARLGYDQTNASVGLKYRPSSLVSLGASLRTSQTRYPRFTDLGNGSFDSDTLKRHDLDLTAVWQYSGLNQFSARISPTRTTDARLVDQNFSGLTGAANWTWIPTGRLSLHSALTRDSGVSAQSVNLGFFGPGVVDYSRVTNGIRTRADFELTSKIALNASLSYAQRDLVNTLLAGGNNLRQQNATDRTSVFGLGAKWVPTRSVELSCNLSKEQRSSSNPVVSVPLRADMFGCAGQLILQ